jgi:hypothetical protein
VSGLSPVERPASASTVGYAVPFSQLAGLDRVPSGPVDAQKRHKVLLAPGVEGLCGPCTALAQILVPAAPIRRPRLPRFTRGRRLCWSQVDGSQQIGRISMRAGEQRCIARCLRSMSTPGALARWPGSVSTPGALARCPRHSAHRPWAIWSRFQAWRDWIADRVVRCTPRSDIRCDWNLVWRFIQPMHRARADLGVGSTNSALTASKIHERSAIVSAASGRKRTCRAHNYAFR